MLSNYCKYFSRLLTRWQWNQYLRSSSSVPDGIFSCCSLNFTWSYILQPFAYIHDIFLSVVSDGLHIYKFIVLTVHLHRGLQTLT